MSEVNRALALLLLRSAIADKEWVIACANMETQKGGWTCDWPMEMIRAEQSIVEILAKLNAPAGAEEGKEVEAEPCQHCGGSGVISYNPNLNPNVNPGVAIVSCPHCKSAPPGAEDGKEVEGE